MTDHPFTAPVSMDFAPVSAFIVEDMMTLTFLLSKLIEEGRAFFCRPEPDGSGWTVVAAAATAPSETLIN